MRVEEKIYDKNVREEIKKRVAGKVDLQLGKKGLTDSFLREVEERLKRQGVVKIRILKSYIRSSEKDRRGIAREVAEKVKARLIEVRGYTFIIAKNKVKAGR